MTTGDEAGVEARDPPAPADANARPVVRFRPAQTRSRPSSPAPDGPPRTRAQGSTESDGSVRAALDVAVGAVFLLLGGLFLAMAGTKPTFLLVGGVNVIVGVVKTIRGIRALS